MNLEYLLQGIHDGTVSIVNLSKRKAESICSEVIPSEVKLQRRYKVIRFEREIIEDKTDYFICVSEL